MPDKFCKELESLIKTKRKKKEVYEIGLRKNFKQGRPWKFETGCAGGTLDTEWAYRCTGVSEQCIAGSRFVLCRSANGSKDYSAVACSGFCWGYYTYDDGIPRFCCLGARRADCTKRGASANICFGWRLQASIRFCCFSA